MAKRVILTPKQQKLMKAIVANPEAGPTALAVQAGYTSKQHVVAALNSPKLRELMDSHPKLKSNKLLDKLASGLDASRSTPVVHKGEVVDTIESPDFVMQHKYLETALKLRGDLKPESPMFNQQLNFWGSLSTEAQNRGLSAEPS